MNILINLQYFIKNDKLKIDMVDNCKKLIIKFRFRNKIYIEQFKQISKNNYELWVFEQKSQHLLGIYFYYEEIFNFYIIFIFLWRNLRIAANLRTIRKQ